VVAGYGRSYSVAMLAGAFGSGDVIAANPPVRPVRYIQSNGIRRMLANFGVSCRHREDHTVVGTHSRFTRQELCYA